jgi:hypothetical protein
MPVRFHNDRNFIADLLHHLSLRPTTNRGRFATDLLPVLDELDRLRIKDYRAPEFRKAISGFARIEAQKRPMEPLQKLCVGPFAAGARLSSGRGAPGAPGFWAGSKASPRWAFVSF